MATHAAHRIDGALRAAGAREPGAGTCSRRGVRLWRLLRLTLLVAVPWAGTAAAQQADVVQPVAALSDSVQALRVRLDCAVCAAPVPPRWIEWVGDTASADVHVRVAPAPAQADAPPRDAPVLWVLSFRREGADRADTLYFAAPSDASLAERQAGLLQLMQLGLARHAADTPLGLRLHVALGAADGTTPGSPAPASPGGAAAVPAAQAAAPAASRPVAGARPAASQRRWAAAVDLGFSGSSGNSDFMALTSGFRVRHLQTNAFRLDWSASFRYGESGGQVAARHAQSKLDFDLGPSARVAPFISVSGERDPFRRLDLRARGGTGARFAVHRGERGEAAVRAAVLYTHERFQPEAGRDPRSEGVWSFKFTGNRQLGESIKVETSSSYDPTMGDFGDYNLDVTSKLSTRITRRLAFTVSHTFAYDSTPVAGVESADQRYQTGLTLDF